MLKEKRHEGRRIRRLRRQARARLEALQLASQRATAALGELADAMIRFAQALQEAARVAWEALCAILTRWTPHPAPSYQPSPIRQGGVNVTGLRPNYIRVTPGHSNRKPI